MRQYLFVFSLLFASVQFISCSDDTKDRIEICNNSIDDDGDGLIDLMDPDCLEEGSECSNNADDDGDGLFDCDDPDCQGEPGC